MAHQVELREVYGQSLVGSGRSVLNRLKKLHVRVNERWVGYLSLRTGNLMLLRPTVDEEREAITAACAEYLKTAAKSLGAVTQHEPIATTDEANDQLNEAAIEGADETLTFEIDD